MEDTEFTHVPNLHQKFIAGKIINTKNTLLLMTLDNCAAWKLPKIH